MSAGSRATKGSRIQSAAVALPQSGEPHALAKARAHHSAQIADAVDQPALGRSVRSTRRR